MPRKVLLKKRTKVIIPAAAVASLRKPTTVPRWVEVPGGRVGWAVMAILMEEGVKMMKTRGSINNRWSSNI